jgi:LmbE family N-acetylglucosaminyl deacetylase
MTTLIVAPHYDDAELGASMFARGGDLVVVAGTDGDRYYEQLKAASALGSTLVSVGEWRDGFVSHDAALVGFIESAVTDDIDRVLSPPVLDTHQDHAATAAAVVSALRRSSVSLVEYETPSAMPTWVPNLWVPMTYEDLADQLTALDCYGSQAGRPYMTGEWIEARAEFRGQQVGIPLAQAFRIVRYVSES